MHVELGKTYYDPQSKCTLTILREYPNKGQVFVKISNREKPEVMKKAFVEKSVTREVT
jgi:hypothetical protein